MLDVAGRPDLRRVLSAAEEMVAEGADILDVGGESTRPGAAAVSLAQERCRVVPVVRALAERFPLPVSVDTGRPEIMREAAEAGAAIINDVRALRRPGALAAAAATDCMVCLMHMQGEPASMQAEPVYADVVAEVTGFLAERLAAARRAGIGDERLLVDPGFGFGKTVAHNLTLLARLQEIGERTGVPVLVGWSRKSTIGAVLDRPVDGRLAGGLAAAVLSVAAGAAVVRTHDVQATRDAILFADACLRHA